MAVTPAVTSIYRPMRRFAPYKRRTIQRTRLDQELRVLVGIHNPRSIPTMINLLEATHPTKHSPLSIFALHLVELTGRATAMMIAHNYSKSSSAAHFKHHTHSRAPVNRTQAYSDQIANALDNYQQQSLGVSASTHTAISPYSSMHEDICNLAEDKRVALILLPFHKEQTLDGAMESANPAFRSINSSVLANAPCSVAILVDRGLATAARAPSSMAHHVIVLFFGGPDDREALACAWHMAEHPAVRLTVVRFVEDGGSAAAPSGMLHLDAADKSDSKMLTMTTEEERERQLDEDYLNQFRLQHASNEAVVYAEKVVGNGEDMVEAIRRLDSVYDLFIVGRGQGSSPLTAGLTDWSECPELGAVGDLLASSDFAATATVLVVQQYVGVMPADGVATPDSPGIQIEQYLDNIRRPRGGPHAYR
ncbi:hypothetical protein ACLOJK_003672 [Asimina triloba]